MTTYSELLHSIIAMDAYNRDNNQGVFHLNLGVDDQKKGTPLGDFVVIASAFNDVKSFYAIAYQHKDSGELIISYRGTDDFTGLLSNDVVKGWAIGAGITGPNQLADAIAFYEGVLNSVQQTTGLTVYNRAPANFTLVGHSLGGGLAGVVASLSGANAFVTDAMPYTIAAWTAYFDGVLKAIGESPAISALLGVSGATALARYTQIPSVLTKA